VIKLSGMTSIFPEWTLDEALPVMKKYGYEGLEPRVEWGHRSGIEASLSASERADVRSKVRDAGLEISCVATGVRAATGDPQERAKHMEDLRTYIDLAADLGAKYVRTFGGPRPRDRELKYIVDYVVEAYLSVLDHAVDRGVTILMETHDDWSHSMEVRAVIEQADHPNLRVLWDIMHPQRLMERPEETFQVIGSLTRHLHAHDGIYPEGGTHTEVCFLGEGVFDHATPVSLLSEAGFDGYFSVEVIRKPGDEPGPEAVLRQYAEAFRGMLER